MAEGLSYGKQREDVESRCEMQNSTDLQNEPILLDVSLYVQ